MAFGGRLGRAAGAALFRFHGRLGVNAPANRGGWGGGYSSEAKLAASRVRPLIERGLVVASSD